MKGYKAFNKDMTCRGFQYKEGKTYKYDGDIKICNKGFHFCENPMDVLNYYDLTEMEFAEVEAKGNTQTENDKDTKVVTDELKIGFKVGIPGFVQASIDYLMRFVDDCNNEEDEVIASSGYSAKLASSGNSAQLASSGDSAKLASSGDSAKLASSGDSAQLASSGNYAKLASSGYSAKLASSGDSAKLASSGNYAKLASSGDSAQLASSGDSAQLELNGSNSVGANIGRRGKIKGVKGTWITLAEYESGKCVCVKSAQIDGYIIKEDTWYKLENKEFVECL